MRNINLRYVKETYDENGLLKDFKIECPDNFNFGYDIVDDIAVNDPDRRALVWQHEDGREKILTFADMKRMSDKTCNYFSSLGIKKGDFVLLVLKHCYQFWYISVALHKMGAIPVPATYMLKPHEGIRTLVLGVADTAQSEAALIEAGYELAQEAELE